MSRPMKATPSVISIKPTRMNFEFGNQVPHYWLDNDPFSTHFISVLSTFFPDGERFLSTLYAHSVTKSATKHDKKRSPVLSAKKPCIHWSTPP